MINFPGIQTNVLLAPYTTYKIGGPADYFFVAKNKTELINAVIEARKNKIEYFILGTGANILVGDKGFRGLVIKNEAGKISIDEKFTTATATATAKATAMATAIATTRTTAAATDKTATVTAESGALIKDLIKITTEKNISGFEHFAGIPSTVGGAVWQNLHFLSPDRLETFFIDKIIDGAEILDEENNIVKVKKDFFNFGYDQSILHNKNLLVTEVTFTLLPMERELIQNQIEENLKWRREKQPDVIEFPSCGSVFKKVAGIGVGRLIDEVGLKGLKIGEAMISEKHANFIVNMGSAKASDVCDLIDTVKEKVFSKTGHNLQTEIGFIGEF
jgi:UDP-N-acetylmuramate dehydrogenase